MQPKVKMPQTAIYLLQGPSLRTSSVLRVSTSASVSMYRSNSEARLHFTFSFFLKLHIYWIKIFNQFFLSDPSTTMFWYYQKLRGKGRTSLTWGDHKFLSWFPSQGSPSSESDHNRTKHHREGGRLCAMPLLIVISPHLAQTSELMISKGIFIKQWYIKVLAHLLQLVFLKKKILVISLQLVIILSSHLYFLLCIHLSHLLKSSLKSLLKFHGSFSTIGHDKNIMFISCKCLLIIFN